MEKELELIFNEDLHFEHKLWESEMEFWKSELNLFEKKLEELIVKWNKQEFLKQLEHFQNEFILQKGIIENMTGDIEAHEIHIAAQTKSGKDVLNPVLVKNHLSFREKMEIQRQIYTDLKKQFFEFLSQYI